MVCLSEKTFIRSEISKKNSDYLLVLMLEFYNFWSELISCSQTLVIVIEDLSNSDQFVDKPNRSSQKRL